MKGLFAITKGIYYALGYAVIEQPSWTGGRFVQFPVQECECFSR